MKKAVEIYAEDRWFIIVVEWSHFCPLLLLHDEIGDPLLEQPYYEVLSRPMDGLFLHARFD